MAEREDQDKTEQATPFKLREARRRGQVSKSLEVNSILLLSVILAVIYFAGESMAARQLGLSRALLADAHLITLEPVAGALWFQAVFAYLLGSFWPLICAVMITGVLANLIQTGPIFALHPIKPDLQRLNLAQGLKRLFSKKLAFETVKTVVKLAMFGAVIYLAIRHLLPQLFSLLDTSTDVLGVFLLDEVKGLLFQLILGLLIIALLDLSFTRWEFGQKMRMSRRELREELKHREGDPRVRARLRELQREAVKRAGALRRVPDADVLITNPTRLAIAVRYERGVMTSPVVLAKGAGGLAGRMRSVASRHSVPIVENRALAKSLFNRVGIDQSVPEDLFPVVARILAWVFLRRETLSRVEVNRGISA